jgi:hypothetical protein
MDSVSPNPSRIAGEPTTSVDSRTTFLPLGTGFFKRTEFPFPVARRRAGTHRMRPYRSSRYRSADGDGHPS